MGDDRGRRRLGEDVVEDGEEVADRRGEDAEVPEGVEDVARLARVRRREEDDAAGLLRVDDGACNASTAREVSSGRQMLRRGRRVSLTVRHVLRSQQAADGFGNASFLAAVNARRVDLSLVLRREA